jgi:hypothetical protein
MADNDFADRIKQIAVTVDEGINRTVKQIALAVDAAVVQATPVDTGRARSNWIASLEVASGDTIEPLAPGALATQAAIQAAIDALAQRKPGQSIHLTNNLPYIVRLNEGHSAQAPSGFVQTAIANGLQSVANIKVIDGQ